jgi:hypothetical protein
MITRYPVNSQYRIVGRSATTQYRRTNDVSLVMLNGLPRTCRSRPPASGRQEPHSSLLRLTAEQHVTVVQRRNSDLRGSAVCRRPVEKTVLDPPQSLAARTAGYRTRQKPPAYSYDKRKSLPESLTRSQAVSRSRSILLS